MLKMSIKLRSRELYIIEKVKMKHDDICFEYSFIKNSIIPLDIHHGFMLLLIYLVDNGQSIRGVQADIKVHNIINQNHLKSPFSDILRSNYKFEVSHISNSSISI